MSRRPQHGLSRVSGPREAPLSGLTVPALLHRTLRAYPNRQAAVFAAAGLRWSWRELAEQVDRLAAGLLALGFYKGERLGIWAPNRPEWLLAQLATARIGVILVNINPAYRPGELAFALNKVGARGIVSAVAFKSSRYLDMLCELAPELSDAAPGRLRCDRLPALRVVIQLGDQRRPGMVRYREVLALGGAGHRARLNAISRSLAADEPINIQFTSGTTGEPKGATLSHRNIVNNAVHCAALMRLDRRDRLCIPVPLYHCFGMVLGNLVCVSVGASMVFPDEGFDAGRTLETLAGERCTAVHGVPTMFAAMLDHPRRRELDLRSLRTGIMAGAPCPAPLMGGIMRHLHLGQMTIAYGMTETSPVSFQTEVDDPVDKRSATVGRVQPHVEVKLIDGEGRTVAVGETGELCIRGYLVMRGYWDDEARSRQVIDAEGWMHSGDLATLDADGYCRIVGRLSDMVIRGGENIYPREIETCLSGHPDVADAQVFGIPDPRLGEELCAWLVPRAGRELDAQAVREYCEGRIAHFKVPRHIRVVDELPMTVTGKPQKFIMRERMLAELARGPG